MPVPQIGSRGYTGHEHYEEFALINMNGRMYDPTIGRMLSADNGVYTEPSRSVQNGASTQAYNRYTYAANNPLKYTDPSGEKFKFFKEAANILSRPARWLTEAASWVTDQINGTPRHEPYFRSDYISGHAAPYSAASNKMPFQNGIGNSSLANPQTGGLSAAYANYDDFENEWESILRVQTDITYGTAWVYSSFKGYYIKSVNRKIIGGKKQNGIELPTRSKGGFINNSDDFHSFMIDQAKNNPVEVAAFGIKDPNTQTIKYFVQPWQNNSPTTSKNNYWGFNEGGFNYTNIIAQFHTHPNSYSLSRTDAIRSSEWGIPVNSIGANGNMWRGDYSGKMVPLDFINYGNQIR